MSDRPVRVGVVGLGGIGRIHLARYADIPEAVVAAVCDADAELARSTADASGARAFEDVGRMLAEVELDAVDICTPPVSHAEAALLAIHAGKNVLCEKPLAHALDAARQMVEAAEEMGVLLMNAFCHRFHPPMVFVKEMIERGELGEIVMFRNRFAGPLPGVEKRWFSRMEVAGGGGPLDTSIHSIDLFRFLVGEVTNTRAIIRTTNAAITEVEDTAITLLSTADNRMGVVEACWSLPDGVQVVEVYGSLGVAMIHYWDGLASRYKTVDAPEWRTIGESGPDRFAGEIRHFIAACRGKSPLAVTGRDGLRALEIVFDAYASAGLGRTT